MIVPRTTSPDISIIVVPALISLVVTLWRLTGELLRWSPTWFNPEPGGFGALVGITWLAPVFGVYFGLALLRAGHAPPHRSRAVILSVIGNFILFGGGALQPVFLARSLESGLIYIWGLGLAAAALQYPAWPRLFRLLLAYGLAARIPVLAIMLLAFRGEWGTHYDAVPLGFPEGGWPMKFMWLGLFPQLLFWVSFTVVTGMLPASVAGAVERWRNPVRG